MECNKALKAMLVLGIVMFIIAASAIFTTNSLRKENAQLKEDYIKLVNERAKCSLLGFCIGDKVEPTDDAKKWNITIGGIVRKIEGKLLTIDTGTPDNQNWQALDEMWVRHGFTIGDEVPRTLPQHQTLTIDLTTGIFSEIIIKYRDKNKTDTHYIINAQNELVRTEETNTQAPNSMQNTSNLSFRQELERMLKTQYAPRILQFKEIVCDRVPYDENCYVRYDIETGGYWITVPKKYANEW